MLWYIMWSVLQTGNNKGIHIDYLLLQLFKTNLTFAKFWKCQNIVFISLWKCDLSSLSPISLLFKMNINFRKHFQKEKNRALVSYHYYTSKFIQQECKTKFKFTLTPPKHVYSEFGINRSNHHNRQSNTTTTKSYPTQLNQLHESTSVIMFFRGPCFYPNH